MMVACETGHEEIVYNEEYKGGRRSKCPLCEANDTLTTLVSNLYDIEDFNSVSNEDVANEAND
jgi:hypothetical protein